MCYSIRTIENLAYSNQEYFSLSSTPADEPCIQVGEDPALARMECEIYIGQLIRRLGNPPGNCSFFVLKNFHEFGIYYEAAIRFDPDNEAALNYALEAESGDSKWDSISKKELIEKGITAAQRR